MNRFDELALVTFITCDLIIEGSQKFKTFYRYCINNVKYETQDVIKKLFK